MNAIDTELKRRMRRRDEADQEPRMEALFVPMPDKRTPGPGLAGAETKGYLRRRTATPPGRGLSR